MILNHINVLNCIKIKYANIIAVIYGINDLYKKWFINFQVTLYKLYLFSFSLLERRIKKKRGKKNWKKKKREKEKSEVRKKEEEGGGGKVPHFALIHTCINV